ncbi:MAG: hypothetical protein GEU74_12465 [Nitriliruptorales bacterium]|nr:hypothetical protein [Nitriliruptorales bacterium]
MNQPSIAAPEQERLRKPRPGALWVPAVFVLIGGVLLLHLPVPDPSLQWGAQDEACCHIPTILLFQERGLLDGVRDYPSATTPLYHLLMATAYGRVNPLALRLAWMAVTLGAGWLLYAQIRDEDGPRAHSVGALAIALAFLLSPTIRASARYFVTDGLPLHLAIAALALLRRSQTSGRVGTHPLWAWLAVVTAYLSLYTRQYYLWVPLYATHSVLSASRDKGFRAFTAAGSAVLVLPLLALFWVWGRVTPPMVWGHHTEAHILVSVPNALSFVAIYSLPALWLAANGLIADVQGRGWSRAARMPLLVLGGLVAFISILLSSGFQVPVDGGILGRLAEPLFGRYANVAFLAVSYCGVVLLVRWVTVDGPRQLWWLVFLLPFVVSGSLLQRYFDPAVIVFLFLVARPNDARTILDSRLVWFYPAFTVAYSVGRVLYLT